MKDRIQVLGKKQIAIPAPQTFNKHLTPQLAFSPLQSKKWCIFYWFLQPKNYFLKSSKLKTALQSRQMCALYTQWQYGMATLPATKIQLRLSQLQRAKVWGAPGAGANSIPWVTPSKGTGEFQCTTMNFTAAISADPCLLLPGSPRHLCVSHTAPILINKS